MNLEMIGNGTGLCVRRDNNNCLVRGTRTTLIDCGTTALRALAQSGVDPTDIDAILITHIHADHVGGLEALAYYYKYVANGYRCRLVLTERIAELLWEHSLRAGLEQDSLGPTCLEDWFEVVICPENTYTLGDCTFEFIPSQHVEGKPSYSIDIRDEYTRVFYSGDLAPHWHSKLKWVIFRDEEYHYDAIFHDVQFFDAGPGRNIHCTYDELVACYPLSMRNRLYLMHLPDRIPGDLRERMRLDMPGARITGEGEIYTF